MRHSVWDYIGLFFRRMILTIIFLVFVAAPIAGIAVLFILIVIYLLGHIVPDQFWGIIYVIWEYVMKYWYIVLGAGYLFICHKDRAHSLR